MMFLEFCTCKNGGYFRGKKVGWMGLEWEDKGIQFLVLRWDDDIFMEVYRFKSSELLFCWSNSAEQTTLKLVNNHFICSWFCNLGCLSVWLICMLICMAVTWVAYLYSSFAILEGSHLELAGACLDEAKVLSSWLFFFSLCPPRGVS